MAPRRLLVVIGSALVVLLLAGFASGALQRLLRGAEHGLRTAAQRVDNRLTRASFGSGKVRTVPGPSRFPAGGTYSLRGHTASVGGRHALGAVVLHGRWNDGSWRVLARSHTRSRSGAYRVTAHLDEHGRLQLRLVTPDGVTSTKTLQVR